jgi:hypothetical protein
MRLVGWLRLALLAGAVMGLAGCPTAATCGPNSCPNGCCDSTGACAAGSATSACGTGGQSCAACSATETCTAGQCKSTNPTCASTCPDGCCAPNGTCITPANTVEACGSNGATCNVCTNSQSCVNGACVNGTSCNSTNCNGCCDSRGSCITNESDSQCGSGVNPGSACVTCSGTTPVCSGGICAPGDAGTTDSGTTDAGANDAGSNDAGSSDSGTEDAGKGDSGTTTDAGSDAGSPCDYTHCSGCCDIDTNQCVTAESNAQCGSLRAAGSQCIVCVDGTACSGGYCETAGDGGVVAIPLTGCVALTYAAPVKIGSSNNTYQLLIDTGSTVMGVGASPCTTCSAAGVSPLYGDTGTDQGMTDSAMYLDGSGWAGEIYQDAVEPLGGPKFSTAVDFVAMTSQTMFFSESDCAGNTTTFSPNQGILGMGPTDLLDPGTTSYFNQLATTTSIPNVFAVQLCYSTGSLWLGGYDPTAASSAPQYSPMVSGGVNGTYMEVNMNALKLGSTSLGTGADISPATIDTGTYALGFSTDVYDTLLSAMQGSATFNTILGNPDAGFYAGNICVPPTSPMTTAQINSALPPMEFTFPTSGASTFSVTAPATQSYLYPMDQGATGGGVYYCWGAFDLMGNGQGSLLGDTFIQNSLTVFDVGANQIGFAPQKSCPLPPARPPMLITTGPIKSNHRNPHGPRVR